MELKSYQHKVIKDIELYMVFDKEAIDGAYTVDKAKELI